MDSPQRTLKSQRKDITGLLETVKQSPLLADGAVGTELQRIGLKPGKCGEVWNVEHPNQVKSIHKAYLEAGAQLITTNSFRGNRYALEYFGLAPKVREFNLAAARLAHEAAAGNAWVIGSVGPFGGFIPPFGETPAENVYAWLSEQISILLEGGVDAILIETMTTAEEMQLAIRAAREVGAPMIMATMSFNKVDDDYQTMKGATIEQGVDAMLAADVIGTNCGAHLKPQDYPRIVRRIRARSDKPILVRPNAGQPEMIGEKIVYKQTPEMMASVVTDLINVGANIIGGCCGTTPEHIRQFGLAIR